MQHMLLLVVLIAALVYLAQSMSIPDRRAFRIAVIESADLLAIDKDQQATRPKRHFFKCPPLVCDTDMSHRRRQHQPRRGSRKL